MENHRDGIWIIGAAATTTYANDGVAETLGTPAPDLVAVTPSS